MSPKPPGRVASVLRRRADGSPGGPRWRRRALAAAALCAATAAAAVPILSEGASSADYSASHDVAAKDGLGVQPGKIKHVWLIVLENKAYDASFTGLNDNTYLWKTLPAQGALLKNYYGTGHFEPRQLRLDDERPGDPSPTTRPTARATPPSRATSTWKAAWPRTRTTASWPRRPGPTRSAGTNGCVYPQAVPTLFNQLDTAHVSWKGYAQDLGNPDSSGPTHDAGAQYCGAPGRKSGRRAPPNSRTRAAPTRPINTLPSTSRSRGSSRC